MSRTRTLTNMLLDVRMRTNMENSTFCTDAELTEYLNQALAKLWRRLCQNAGQPFYRSSTTYTVTSATTLQALPADFYQVQEVSAVMGGFTYSLTPFMAAERGALKSATVYTALGSPQYRVQANNIEFLPVSQSFTATLFYAPAQPRLAVGSDVFDGFAGYELAALYETCAIVNQKEETDPSFYAGQAAAIYADIDLQIAQRDAANPERVQDVVGNMDNASWWFR